MTPTNAAAGWLVTPNPTMLRLAADLPRPRYTHSLSWRVKRLLDVVVSAGALALLSPVVVAAAVSIAVSSPGPIFFRQERITARGRRYQCLKFRTMRAAVDQTPHLRLLDRLVAGDVSTGVAEPPQFKLTVDSRTPRIGRWLRKTSLDEWNARRQSVAAQYEVALQGLDLITPHVAPDRQHIYHLYVVRARRRDELMSLLKELGIEVLIHYPVPIHRQPAFQSEAFPSLPVTEDVTSEILSLPMWPLMSEGQVRETADGLRVSLDRLSVPVRA
jgi:hypothetical protein